MDKLYWPIFDELSQDKRQAALKEISNRFRGFKLKHFEKFEKFGQSTNTAAYEFENSEFIFVPGDVVTLGWGSFEIGINNETCKDIIDSTGNA